LDAEPTAVGTSFDIFDILNLIQAVHNGELETEYRKMVLRKVLTRDA
jgi:hypothetical protein